MSKLSTNGQAGSKEQMIEYVMSGERMPPAYQVLPPKFREFCQPIQDLKIYDDDVWIVTFPKSGANWMKETLCSLLHGLDLDKLKSKDYKRSINVEDGCFRFSENIPETKLSNLPEFLETLERPRVIKTHLYWENLPKTLRDPICKAKIVYIGRNPKDVCASLFYHYKILHGEKFQETVKNFQFFAGEFMNDRIGFGPYWTHIYKFWARRNNSKILYISYEDIKMNFPDVFDKIQKFLNLKPLTVDSTQKLMEYLSFTNHKKRSREFFRENYVSSTPETDLIEEDQVDEWMSKMAPEISQKFDNWILENSPMKGYEEFEMRSFCKL